MGWHTVSPQWTGAFCCSQFLLEQSFFCLVPTFTFSRKTVGFQLLLSPQFLVWASFCSNLWCAVGGGPGPFFLFLCLVINGTHDWDSLTIIMAAFLGSWASSALSCLRKAYLLIFNFYVCAYLVVCIVQITQKYPVFGLQKLRWRTALFTALRGKK